MKLGELFFDLAFKTKGILEAANFKGAIDKTKGSLENLKGSLDKTNLSQNKTLSLNLSLKNMFMGMIGVIKRVAFGITGIGSAILYTLKQGGDMAMNIDLLNTSTGKSTGFLYNMKKQAAEAGISFESLASGLQRVQQIKSDISLGKTSPSAFYSALGIDPHADYPAQLQQLSDAIKRFPEQGDRVRAGARDIGFSAEEINYATRTTDIMSKLNKEAGSEISHKRMVQFHKTMESFGERMKMITVNLATVFMPVIEKVLKATEKFVGSIKKEQVKEWRDFFNWLMEILEPVKYLFVAIGAVMFPWAAGLATALFTLKEIWAYTKGEKNIFSSMGSYLSDFEGIINSIIKGLVWLGRFYGMTDEEAIEMEETGKVKAKSWGDSIKSGLKSLQKSFTWGMNSQAGATGSAGQLRPFDELKRKEKIKPTPAYREARIIKPNKLQEAIDAGAKFSPKMPEPTVTPGMIPIGKSPQEKPKGPVTNNQTLNINVNESKDPKLTAQMIQKTIGEAWWQLQRGEV